MASQDSCWLPWTFGCGPSQNSICPTTHNPHSSPRNFQMFSTLHFLKICASAIQSQCAYKGAEVRQVASLEHIQLGSILHKAILCHTGRIVQTSHSMPSDAPISTKMHTDINAHVHKPHAVRKCTTCACADCMHACRCHLMHPHVQAGMTCACAGCMRTCRCHARQLASSDLLHTHLTLAGMRFIMMMMIDVIRLHVYLTVPYQTAGTHFCCYYNNYD